MAEDATGPEAGKPIAEMSFEEALAELESVVGRLETGEVPLEQSIALYERGDALKKHCEEKLREAELKVEKIVAGPDGKAAGTAPFEAG
ncbi:MAG TPA: exodeoxyribonuclease VII small subunit [Thermohalobaculum sp.]|nr:exodeoxyribonuclease VII small subunit [Thermohalobaculum sp.]